MLLSILSSVLWPSVCDLWRNGCLGRQTFLDWIVFMYWPTCMQSLEKWYRWIHLQRRNKDTDVGNKRINTRGWEGERDELGDWGWRTYKADNYREPTIEHRELLSALQGPTWEGNPKRRDYMQPCVDSLRGTAENNTVL